MKCTVYIARQAAYGRVYAAGWYVATIVAMHANGTMDVRDGRGHVWSRCDPRCVRVKGV